MDRTITNRRILPPGNIENMKVTFGILWIKLGDLKLVKDTSRKIKLQFWGEEEGIVLQASNSVDPEYNRRAQYEVRSPVVFFQKYLNDMKGKCKLVVEGIGNVSLDFRPFFVTVTERSKQAFEHFKGAFQIVNNEKKVGTLQIEAGCNFNPDIYELDMQENIECQCQRQCIQRQQQCDCQCHDDSQIKKAVEVLAVKQPWKLDQINQKIQPPKQSLIKDNRIPNSLNIQMPSNKQFIPQKYKDQLLPKIQLSKPSPKSSQIHSPQMNYFQSQHESEIKSPQIVQKSPQILFTHQQIEQQHQKQAEEFPDIEKVLTYSNLQLQKQLGVDKKDDEEERNLKKEFYGEDLSNNQSFKHVDKNSSPNQLIRNSSEHVRSLQVSPTPVTDRIVEYPLKRETSDPSDNEQKVLKIAPYEMKQSSKLASPKNSIISPRQYAFQPQLQSQHINANSFYNPPLNSTSLLLNLHCQISEIKLQSPVLFHLIYKIYGNADRNRIDYKGQPITIVSLIGNQQLKLMDKLPFIVQIRNTRDKSKFIGFIKISLQKIKDAFLINGNINEKAVKANIMPTIIFQGQTTITQIKGDIVGRSFVNLILGTGQQISNYINNKQKQKQPKITKQTIKKNVQQVVVLNNNNNINFSELLCEFMQYLRNNNIKIADSLLKLLSHKELNLENYSSFLQQINKIQFITLFNLFDYKRKGSFPIKILSDSFQEFNKAYERLKDQKQTSQLLWKSVVNNNIISSIQNNSEFGLVSKDKLQRILQQLTTLRPYEIESILKQNPQSYFSIQQLKNGLKQMQKNSLISYSPVVYGQTVSDMIRDSVIQSDLQLGDLLTSLSQTRVLNIQEVNRVFRNLPDSLSLWSTFMLMSYVKKTSGDKNTNILQIGYPQLCNWCLALKQNVQKQKFRRKQEVERKENQMRLKQDKIRKQKQQKQQQIRRQKKIQQQKDLQNQRNNQAVYPAIVDLQVNQNNTNSQILSQTIKPHNDDQNHRQQQSHPRIINQKPSIQEPSLPQQLQPQLYSHNFSIQGIELSLDNHSAGQCLISYKFPQQQQLIISKTIHINSSKHKYAIRLLGKHSINLNIPIENYLGDNILKIDVSLDGKIFCTSGIPCNQLLESGTKVVGLFTTTGEEAKLTGKLKLEINYNKQVSKQGQLGQTISKQMYLPKVGYLNAQVSSAIEPKKLALQHKIKQDFFLSISFNPFYQSPQLSSLYKPLQSKVQSAMTQIVYLRDHIKLRLASNIIQYMKNHSVKIYLIAVYYKQQPSINRRNQMIIGTIDIPMLSIISGRGIHGDYAFKNKFGIFMGLARCDISYDKNKIQSVPQQVSATKLHLQQKVYIVVNILEFLNLSEPMKWISFQSTVKTHHSTPRNHLSGNKLFAHLQSSSFLFEIQDIYSLTFISIIIKNSLHLNLSFDISMRPIINSLSKHRHTAYSSYFTVVSQQIQHMRVGAKIFAFRGNQIASQFASKLHQNPQTNVFQYIDIPKQLDNYPKMVDLLRKQLSIQKSTFDQIISYILQPKQRFNIQLFSNRIFFRLDFLQLYSQAQLLSICEQSTTILQVQQIMNILRKNQIDIVGFKNEETLEKFKFRNLDLHKIDRNIQLFSLEEMVDVITFIRKIDIPEIDSVMQQDSFVQSYRVYVLIEKGKNFESLYNGIKPNALIRCNGLDLQTNIAQRQSNPEYNQEFQFQLSAQDLNKIRKLHFQVRHKTSLNSKNASDVLIGRATADISSALSMKDKNSSILYAIPITSNNSQYKGLKKPELIVRIRAQKISNQSYYNQQSAVNPSGFEQYSHSGLKIDGSIDIDRVADIMKQDTKMQMFQDSESQNSYSQY